MIGLSCLINASGVGRTEKIYNIFGSKKDLIIVILPISDRPRQLHNWRLRSDIFQFVIEVCL